jgi:hypothetical protein
LIVITEELIHLASVFWVFFHEQNIMTFYGMLLLSLTFFGDGAMLGFHQVIIHY